MFIIIILDRIFTISGWPGDWCLSRADVLNQVHSYYNQYSLGYNMSEIYILYYKNIVSFSFYLTLPLIRPRAWFNRHSVV